MICVISVERALQEGMNSELVAQIADWHADKARAVLVPHNGKRLSDSKQAERRAKASRHHDTERALRRVAAALEKLEVPTAPAVAA